MIPILYESTETAFATNGLGRLRDCLSCVVVEERNGIYECDFTVPVDGAHFSEIIPGRIIAVTHDDTGDVQPFDIVSMERPIDGVVTFHAVHISYRQGGMTVAGKNINSLADALALLSNAEPSNPFTYQTDKTSSAYMAAADGVPRTVRQMLGGVEGSILDAYGGEYEFDRFNVYLHSARGVTRDLKIRYGVNLLDFNDSTDYSGTYSSVIPFWTGQNAKGVDTVVVGNRVDSGLDTYNGRNDCIPLDLTEKFETIPTKAALQTMAAGMIRQANVPAQTITVDFIRLQDMPEYSGISSLLTCRLCDSVTVIFPKYNMQGVFKIVSVEWDALAERYNKMELGQLSTTLAEALGITSGNTFREGIEGGALDPAEIVDALTTGGYYAEHFEGTKNTPNTGYCYGAYDPVSGMVVVGWAASHTSTVSTTTNLFTIPEKYRPTAGRRGFAMHGTSTSAPNVPSMCNVNTSGQIRQLGSNSWRIGFGVIAYGINEPE